MASANGNDQPLVLIQEMKKCLQFAENNILQFNSKTKDLEKQLKSAKEKLAADAMTIANLTAICSSLRAENEFVKLQNEQLATRINEMLQQSSGSFSNLWSPPTTLFNNPTLTPILSYQQSNFGDVQQSTKTPPANRESNEKSSVIATKLKVDQGKGTRDSVGDSFFEDLAVLQNNEVYQDFHPSENSWNHPVQKKKLRNQTKPSNTSVPPGIPQKTRSLAVNGVAKLSKRDILNYFSKFGTIELYTDPINNSARKFVFVRFSDYGTVDKIVEQPQHTICNQQVYVGKAKDYLY